jgi:hypothetical protein
MTNKFIVTFYCLAALSNVFLSGSEYTTIWGGEKKNIDQGCIFYNKYCQTAFMNPSRFGARVKAADFAVMPHKDVDNKATYEEEAAKIRLFFRPDVSVRTAGRRTQTVTGQANWVISKIKDGVVYTRKYKRNSSEVKTEITVISRHILLVFLEALDGLSKIPVGNVIARTLEKGNRVLNG